jgi:NifB/MoaA-like Fe-S oxidoreductase
LAAQLKEQKLGERLLLPCNLLRSGENVFLDDMTLEELENTLQVPIDIVKSSGQDLLDAMLCID